jgi:hypothetical protein
MRQEDFDQCYKLANDLYTKEKAKGKMPVLLQVAGFKGDPEVADARWKTIPPKYWHHYVVVIDNVVYDPTAGQFGQTKTEYAVGELGKNWNMVLPIIGDSYDEEEYIK